MRPILVASNIVMDVSRSRILLGRRADNDCWEFPGGKVEAESVVEAGRREQYEETGMELLGEPALVGLADGWEWIGVTGKQWYVCAGLLWTRFNGEPELVEGKHVEWRWFSGNELPSPKDCTYGTIDLMKIMIAEFSNIAQLLTK